MTTSPIAAAIGNMSLAIENAIKEQHAIATAYESIDAMIKEADKKRSNKLNMLQDIDGLVDAMGPGVDKEQITKNITAQVDAIIEEIDTARVEMDNAKKQMQKLVKIALKYGGGLPVPQAPQAPQAQAPSRKMHKVSRPRQVDYNMDVAAPPAVPETLEEMVALCKRTTANSTSAFGTAIKTLNPDAKIATKIEQITEKTELVCPGGTSLYVSDFSTRNIQPIPVPVNDVVDIAFENIARSKMVPPMPQRDLAAEIAAMQPIKYTVLTAEQKQKIEEAAVAARKAATKAGNGCPLVDYGPLNHADPAVADKERYGLHCGFVLVGKDGNVLDEPEYITLRRDPSQGPKLFPKIAKSIELLIKNDVLSKAGYALFFDENTQHMATKVGQPASPPCIIAMPQECFSSELVLDYIKGATFRPKCFMPLQSAETKRFQRGALKMLFDEHVAELLDVQPERRERQNAVRRVKKRKSVIDETMTPRESDTEDERVSDDDQNMTE